MIFEPQKYAIPDESGKPFIDPAEIRTLLAANGEPSVAETERVLARSAELHRLTLAETAVLLRARTPELRQMIFEAAGELKRRVYGERIVIFAPLYVGNRCTNNCAYCGFRASNREAVRVTLAPEQLRAEVETLESQGQRRLILVWGEHPDYSPRAIADAVRQVYSVRGAGRINRVNINAAPLDTEGFRVVREAGIGTYQIFQETYDPERYAEVHPSGRKRDFDWRLTALDRAMEAGVDDVGLGALVGLGDWRYEAMALVRHANHLEACFGVGPHTISFPRIRSASGLASGAFREVDDEDFALLIAVLRLAVPYTGLILTAREPQQLRDRLIGLGVSQIDAGTRLEIGGYSSSFGAGVAVGGRQDLHREQFELMDTRSLSESVSTLIDAGQIPSFCTACYRKGRTGEHFMEFSTRGFIKRFCTPNALLTLAEYLEDYAPAELRSRGWRLIDSKLTSIDEGLRREVSSALELIRAGEREMLL
ncbi:MAG: [FeFe] hydrogenase H-cluster radical SAM maturase HydG [Rikenellaceae bacterium]|jgi:2-iminoacetate synthase|nr:[FeFe] hydrogenase H-cluster radical SAM maturase HydG [Rikenellaceae bacterium]